MSLPKKQTISKTRIEVFQRCHKLHDLMYEQGYRPISKSRAFAFGSSVHLILEAYWKHGRDFMWSTINWPEEMEKEDKAKATALCKSYIDEFADHDERTYEVVGVELPFTADLVNPDTYEVSEHWTLTGVIDAVARDKQTGAAIVFEHKTTSLDLDPAFWSSKLILNRQAAIYQVVVEQMGVSDEVKVVFDFLQTPRMERLTATPPEKRKYVKATGKLYKNQRETTESIESYYNRLISHMFRNRERYLMRLPVAKTADSLVDSMRDVWSISEQMRHNRALNGLVPKSPDRCFDYNRPCDFFGHCAYGEDYKTSAQFRKIRRKK